MNEPDYKRFAIAIMNGFPEPDGEGIDGMELQELATDCGLLTIQEMAGPCGERCQCAEILGSDAFPTKCYRINWDRG
jgi:hypothetical protein